MCRQGWIVLCSLLVLAVALVGCGGATPTPIVVVVTSAPTPPAVVTMVVTPPPPSAPTSIPVPTAASVPTSTPAPAAGIEVQAVTFAHGLSEQMEPVDPGADFLPDETVHLSVEIKGRPKEGTVTARFYWHDSLIAEADVDLADANSGVLFAIGENTYAGYSLTHDQAFPVSDQYRAEVLYNGQLLDSYPFQIVPPAEAIPTQINQVILALGVDENYDAVDPTTTFAADDTVNLVGHGDLGLDTWLQADWYVNGQLDEAGTRSLTLSENAADTGFAFSYLPEGGWPAGEHYVVLTVNDREVGRYTFTVDASGGVVPGDHPAF